MRWYLAFVNWLINNVGYHTLYEWYRKVENEHFPDPTGLRARIERWTFGLYPACIKYLMSAFDVPEVTKLSNENKQAKSLPLLSLLINACNYQVMAVTRQNICKHGMDSLSRGGAVIYYTSVFLYFWVFSTPVVSLIFGSYLYICINWLHVHFDEAFSSLRIANYKSFTRFHINTKGDLEVFTLAVDKVRNWYQNTDCRWSSVAVDWICSLMFY